MLVIPATLAQVATPETMGQQVIVVAAERAATAEAEPEVRVTAERAAMPVTPAVVQVNLLQASFLVPEGRAVIRAAALAETEGRVTLK